MAADNSAPLPFPCGTGVPEDRLRSADWDRLGFDGSTAGFRVGLEVEFVDRQISGEGNLVVFGCAGVEEEDEEDGEGDKYLDETCFPRGFFETTPLSLRGSLAVDSFGVSGCAFCSNCCLRAGDCREGVGGRENATTIISRWEKFGSFSAFLDKHQ